MKALSVRAPWWYAILHLGKDVENRDWYTNFRGTVWLHAGKWWSAEEVADDWSWSVAEMYRKANPGRAKLPVPKPSMDEMKAGCGCLVGTVDIVGCVMHHDSPWFVGKHGFMLANPFALARPIPFKGALGFFEVPEVQGSVVRGQGSGREDWMAADEIEFHAPALGLVEIAREPRPLDQSELWGDPEPLSSMSARVDLTVPDMTAKQNIGRRG